MRLSTEPAAPTRPLHTLNVNIADYTSYLQRLEARNGDEFIQELDRTHPPMSERLEKLEIFSSSEMRTLAVSESFGNFMNHLTSLE